MKNLSLALPNPPLQALQTTQREFALRAGRAWKYPREVAPFAAIEENSAPALRDLFSLMEPGEGTYVQSEDALVLPPGLQCEDRVGVLQFTYPEDKELPGSREGGEAIIEPLSCADSPAMVELTNVAFPGFFRRRTCEMGQYYGIREGGRLVAMCGERMNVGRFREISGLCTHPETRGRGFAARLMMRLMLGHRTNGDRSYLHVAATNANAIALYGRMGFELRGEFSMVRVTREG